VPKAAQTGFAPIIYHHHSVDVEVSNAQNIPCFGKIFYAGNNTTGGN